MAYRDALAAGVFGDHADRDCAWLESREGGVGAGAEVDDQVVDVREDRFEDGLPEGADAPERRHSVAAGEAVGGNWVGRGDQAEQGRRDREAPLGLFET